MIKRGLFRKPKNELEGDEKLEKRPAPNIPDEMCLTCPDCKKVLFTGRLPDSCHVCPHCGYHFRLNARQRIHLFADPGTFAERDGNLVSRDTLSFPGYPQKLEQAGLESAEKESVVCGECRIGGRECCLFVMEPYFMMGSLGVTAGEKITRLFEHALEKKLPVIGFTVSGGARMQEGVLALMQMAKTSGAVKRHGDAGLLYIAVLTNPTTGGVTASFAMEGDVILAEPGALIGFAGPRVIEQTLRQKLPQGFQRSEFLLERGFVDSVTDRRKLKALLERLLLLHERRPCDGCL
ncbi:acetyl-CoA carboxylase, carboxyltransferase subunit beta [Papillibacter cinnamivorans]|uniref:Acetyl-coenzyme A carboxylase carboxyl transferase subunit beta n=1 Tax=Papillibacter cinnamivorans DSM 12816 TaxID=1122930 RepID=A0A1W2AHS5_9FIRM|nr:acetyl-CoA carboxylase, carboxyltransferase subunit beta [Papillibacter cinnamivorans]SMC60164.1 acetyl-CoA carboxylase carboxyl transferase subunit beta [Papillibacter cinnamivorans DSM 12816]